MNCKAKCLKITVLVVAGIAALGWAVMVLWNWLMPSLFLGAQTVSYCQALGLLLLSKILFGGLRHGCHRHCGAHHQRWDNMTPEEREQLKGRFKRRWGSWCKSSKCGDDAPHDDTATTK